MPTGSVRRFAAISLRSAARSPLIATAAKRTPGKDGASACMSERTAVQEPPSTNSASTTGPCSYCWQMFRISGPLTLQAGTAPAAPWPAAVATFASPLRFPSASGTANGASGCPGAIPLAPLGLVTIVLIVIRTRITMPSSPT